MSKPSYYYTIHDRLLQIAEAITIITGRCDRIATPDDFLASATGMMIFDSCVMRLQTIGEQVSKLLKEPECPLLSYPQIPWRAICDLRNVISHEYANIDEILIFNTIKEDLPILQNVIEEMLKQYPYAPRQ